MNITLRSILCLVLATLAAILFGMTIFFRERLETSRARIETLQLRIEALEQAQAISPAEFPGLSPRDIARFQDRGLENPVEDIRADLALRPDIIPHEGVLGGRMGFYFPERIYVLTDRWVLAYFEDGHRGGRLLLRYDVGESGRISWEVIRSYLI